MKKTVETVYDFLLETMCRFPKDEDERDAADKNTLREAVKVENKIEINTK